MIAVRTILKFAWGSTKARIVTIAIAASIGLLGTHYALVSAAERRTEARVHLIASVDSAKAVATALDSVVRVEGAKRAIERKRADSVAATSASQAASTKRSFTRLRDSLRTARADTGTTGIVIAVADTALAVAATALTDAQSAKALSDTALVNAENNATRVRTERDAALDKLRIVASSRTIEAPKRWALIVGPSVGVGACAGRDGSRSTCAFVGVAVGFGRIVR